MTEELPYQESIDPARLHALLEEEIGQPPPWRPGMLEQIVREGRAWRRFQFAIDLLVGLSVVLVVAGAGVWLWWG